MQFSSLLPKNLGTRLVAMTLISGLIPAAVFVLLIGTFDNRFSRETNRAIQQGQEEEWERSAAVLRRLTEGVIRCKTLDVALQLELYLQAHPEMTVEDLQNDPKFREISIQPIGRRGYTSVHDSDTIINRFHKDPMMENLDLHSLSDNLPAFWAIMKASLGGRYSSGYYKWEEPDGQICKKFICIAPLSVRTADGVRFGVAATTYADEFIYSMQAAQDVSQSTTRYLMISVNRLIRSFRTTGFMFMGLGIVLILALTSWVGICFSRGINQFRSATRAVNQGDFAVRLKPTMAGDVRGLIEDFNQMVGQLAMTTVRKEQLETSEEKLRTTNAQLREEIAERIRTEGALLESEEKYRTILETIEAGYYEVDIEGNFTFFNDSMCKILKYTKDELLGMNGVDCIAPKDRNSLYNVFRQMQRTGKPAKVTGFEFIGKDGNIGFLEVSASLIRDQGGQPIGSRGVARDMTEHKHAEEEKRRLETQFQRAQKMESIGTLAGGIAHDFNNLLMGIMGNISLMILDIDSSHPQVKRLKTIEKYVQSGAELTKQLLGFARGGKYEVRPTNLNEIVEKTSQMFGRTKKEIAVYPEYQEDIYTVEVDQGQIEQVLLNLYVNAWQAMPGGGELYLQTENVTLGEDYVKPFNVEQGNYVKISVTDTGVGMDAETQQRIFDPFFTTKELGRGTGLGLASAYGIIRNHGGIMNVYSEKGKGTTFNIYLLSSKKEVTEEKVLPEKPLKGTETVLFVDDEEMIIDVAEKTLKMLGYKVLLAVGGKEAIEVFRENHKKIDLVILDMIMPDIGGGDVYDRLKEFDPNVKVLLSSGYSIRGQATEILDRGCNGFVQKPFNIETLSQKIREILDKK